MQWKRLLFKIHGITGLVTGILLTLLGLSGAALVFMPEIDRLANAHKTAVTPPAGATPLSLDSMYRIITARHPQAEGIAWTNPDKPGTAYQFRIYENDGNVHTYDLALTDIHPYTGAVIRDGSYRQFSPGFMFWLFQFHFSFQWGMPGTLLTALMGISMVISVFTGIIIYRKHCWRVFTFREKLNRKNRRTLTSGLHRIIGVWSLLPNTVIFFTGFWMNLFAFQPATWQRKSVAAPVPMQYPLSIDSLYAAGRQAMPELIPVHVYIPAQAGKKFRISGPVPGQAAIFGKSGNSVQADPVTGNITRITRLSEKTWQEKLEAVIQPIHVGSYGGIPVKILYVVLGLIPGLLSITGFLLYYKRKNKTGRQVHRPRYVAANQL